MIVVQKILTIIRIIKSRAKQKKAKQSKQNITTKEGENTMEKETNTTIQIALRLSGEAAEKIKLMAEIEDRSFAYIATRLIKQRLDQCGD